MDDVLEGLGIAGLVGHVPAQGLEEGVDEFQPDLSLVIQSYKLSEGVARFKLKERKAATVQGKRLCQVTGGTEGEGKIYGRLTAYITTVGNVDYTFTLLTVPEYYEQNKLFLERIVESLSVD